MSDKLRVHIRWALRRDMPEMMEIEAESFTHPWREDDFIRCLRQRNCIGMVAEGSGQRAGQVVGFMVYELHKTGLHILNFAVDPDCRRQGVGRQMIEKLLGKLSTQRRVRITLEVRESNLVAHKFFRSVGFRAVSILRAYYDDCDEDAYLFQFRQQEEAAAAVPVNRIDRMDG